MLKAKQIFLPLLAFVFWGRTATAEIILAPYYSVKSDKAITPNKKTKTETETKTMREEKGLTVGIRFYRALKLIASVGQNFQVTEKTSGIIKDEYGEIDFAKDLSSTPAVGTLTVKKKETQNVGKVSFMFDPSFGFLIARAKAGVTARQRLISLYENGVLKSEVKPGVTYFPHAGFGFGIKIRSNMYVMAEYALDFYAFPKTKPFEREFLLSYAFSI